MQKLKMEKMNGMISLIRSDKKDIDARWTRKAGRRIMDIKPHKDRFWRQTNRKNI